jgi:glycosyltransferase involved in cell wall biosynthesis
MNRIDDIKKTLPQNLKDNEEYNLAEFILLDYGSTDGLGEWVQKDLSEHISTGRLTYYYTKQEHFRPNHSRNVSFRLAQGEVVTNVDADNFTHHGFLKRLNQCASVSPGRILIVPESFLKPQSDRLILRGRFALYRDDLLNLGGFDESLDDGYSHDDVNFVFRAILDGYNLVRFEDKYLEGRVETPISNRTKYIRRLDFELGKKQNSRITTEKLSRCEIAANKEHYWGDALLVKNFHETIQTQ